MKIVVILSFVALSLGENILVTNDDGWAVALFRAQNDALRAAGYSTVVSAPAENQSGTGSSSAPPTTLEQPCQFDTCPVGSPPEGSDPDDPTINYVNSFPVDAVRFGIQTLSPKFFGGRPDLVVSGPNTGNNIFELEGSGTVGAATEAALEGIPSIAFSSGGSAGSVSYTTLTTDPDSSATKAARVYADISVRFVDAILAGPKPILPPNISINVNYGPVTDSQCSSASDWKFILTRVKPDFKGDDVKQCGITLLPDETSVIVSDTLLSKCFVTVSVFDARTQEDVDAATQKVVRDRISGLLSCLVEL
ncbi:sure-like protein [Marasmius fiardii PR-910]|nr:sure-like protein [Marasmius fiardii PR-910]